MIFKRNNGGIYRHLAGMFEIHGDTCPDDGLNLPDPPIPLPGVDDQIAGFKAVHAVLHVFRPVGGACRAGGGAP